MIRNEDSLMKNPVDDSEATLSQRLRIDTSPKMQVADPGSVDESMKTFKVQETPCRNKTESESHINPTSLGSDEDNPRRCYEPVAITTD
mmetsp:Transcript_22519/g.34818  ORF Transcript_22519/g.34818 Transcript_22519/m.34818 type:complete len:89 (+) Transcript_22519:2796-3062(+)